MSDPKIYDAQFKPGKWVALDGRSFLVEDVHGQRALISDDDGAEKWVDMAQLDKVRDVRCG